MQWFKSKIERQLDEFVAFKVETQNECVATEQRIWVEHFIEATGIKSASEITGEHVRVFADWLDKNTHGLYHISQANHSLCQFLRYYKLHNLMETIKRQKFGGRQLNREAVDMVQKYRAAGLTLEDVQAILERKLGKKPRLSTISFWANYNNPSASN